MSLPLSQVDDGSAQRGAQRAIIGGYLGKLRSHPVRRAHEGSQETDVRFKRSLPPARKEVQTKPRKRSKTKHREVEIPETSHKLTKIKEHPKKN